MCYLHAGAGSTSEALFDIVLDRECCPLTECGADTNTFESVAPTLQPTGSARR